MGLGELTKKETPRCGMSPCCVIAFDGDLCLVVATQNLNNLVSVKALHLFASGTAVLAGVKLTGLLVEDLAHCSSESETAVAVDVDLANSALCSLAQLLLGDTYSVRHLATVVVDDLNILLGN